MDPNPPQGNTNFCWASAVVCAAHDLGYDVQRWRSADGVRDLVEWFRVKKGVKPLDKTGRGGINRVVQLAAALGIDAVELHRQTGPSVKSLVAEGARPVVMWTPREVAAGRREGWCGTLHAGAILRWDAKVYVSDSYADDTGSSAAVRTFTAPSTLWFKPKIAVLRARA